jgi:3-oxoacyl-[acyl-carrier-protein] synthase II
MSTFSPKRKCRIAVTGLGTVSPLGLDVETTWNALIKGESGAGKITHFDAATEFDVEVACEVKNFDPAALIDVKEQKRMDRFIQLGMIASHQAVTQAGFREATDPNRVAVLLSSGIGGLFKIEEAYQALVDGRRISPFFIPSVITNLLPGQVSMHFGFKGPNFCISSACSSSAHAIGEGLRMIEHGDVDVAVVGGAEAPVGVGGFAAMKALAKRNEEPTKASRPFDMDRNGFVIAEGAATLVIENWEHAVKRGAKILAEVVGYGTNSDAHHLTAPMENGEGAADCMRLALKDAGLEPAQIDYINMHGTSTKQGDVAESRAIESVFGAHAREKLHCSSSKSMTGHMLGAAGAFETIVCLMTAQTGWITPTINLDRQDPECKLNYTPHKAVEKSVHYALNNSFGFGGTNVSLILKKYS